MLRTALTAFTIAGIATSAMAIDGPKYDRKIEVAVKKIVARKVGDIRGAFDAEALPFVAHVEAEAAGNVDVAAQPTEPPMIQVAELDVALRPGFLSPAQYHSGRPEPIRVVRKVTSFQYF